MSRISLDHVAIAAALFVMVLIGRGWLPGNAAQAEPAFRPACFDAGSATYPFYTPPCAPKPAECESLNRGSAEELLLVCARYGRD